MRSCLVVGRVFLISGQKIDVSRGCLSDRVAMLQMSNALKSTSEGRSPKVCRAMVLPSSCGVEASVSQEALPGGAKLLENQLAVVSRLERAGVSGLGSAITRRGCRRSRYKQRIRTAYDGPAKLDSRRAATQILSPHLREPAAARQIRTLSPACLAVLPSKFEPSFFPPDRPECPLIPAPALFVRHHHTAARTHTEHISSLIPESAHSTRSNIDAAHPGSPGGYSWTVKKSLFIWFAFERNGTLPTSTVVE